MLWTYTWYYLLPDLQSAYHAYHSTETTVLKVLSDLHFWHFFGPRLWKPGHVVTFWLVGCVWQSVDHHTLLQQLHTSYGLVVSWWSGSHLTWLAVHSSSIQVWPLLCHYQSCTESLKCLSLAQFSSCCTLQIYCNWFYIISWFAIHLTTTLRFTASANRAMPLLFLTECLPVLMSWCHGWRPVDCGQILRSLRSCGTCLTVVTRQHQIPTMSVQIRTTDVLPVTSVWDLGMYMDSDITMRTHVIATVRSCFSALRQLRSVRWCLSEHVLMSLSWILVVSKVDYSCSALAGISGHLLDRHRSILNSAAQLITLLLCELHWLQMPDRIRFHLCILMYYCLSGTAPSYLTECICQATEAGLQSCLFVGNFNSNCSVHPTFYVGRLSIVCHRSSCMEQSTFSCTCFNISHHHLL